MYIQKHTFKHCIQLEGRWRHLLKQKQNIFYENRGGR